MAPPAAVHIIDDDEAVRDSLAVLLETRGFEVATFDSAPAFLDQAKGDVGGCVVSDVQMPGMSGLQLLRALRARKLTIPVLLITAGAAQALADEALAHGAHAVLQKPFAPEAFVQAILAALAAG